MRSCGRAHNRRHPSSDDDGGDDDGGNDGLQALERGG
jgi:hypothetical protein